MAPDFQDGGGGDGAVGGPVGGPEPALRGGGLPLPGLKRWRLERGLSQAELAQRAGLTADYLFKVESGRRGATPRRPRSWPRSWRSICGSCGPCATTPGRNVLRPLPHALGSPTGGCTKPT